MFPFMRVTITFTVCCVVLVLASNLSGFFTSYKDDPHWAEPASAKKDAGTQTSDGSASPEGRKVFATRCATCHQANGKGIPGVYPSLAGSEWAQGDQTRPIRIVLSGFQGKISRSGKDYNGVMTPWKDILSDEEIAQVLTHVRSSWGNKAEAVDPKAVADIRAKTVAKSGGYAEAELKNPL